jgi:hypothetical protein
LSGRRYEAVVAISRVLIIHLFFGRESDKLHLVGVCQ